MDQKVPRRFLLFLDTSYSTVKTKELQKVFECFGPFCMKSPDQIDISLFTLVSSIYVTENGPWSFEKGNFHPVTHCGHHPSSASMLSATSVMQSV
jgi:hypothetical protein